MAAVEPLSAELSVHILRHFGLPDAPPPNLETLLKLLVQYTRKVPWESASRIVRRARHENAVDCAILGADFWDSHLELGTGGTCYESNYAFFGLLLRLGYEGYLTINDMGASVGCHAAIALLIEGKKFLVDVGYPLHAILPLFPESDSVAESPFMRYTATPLSDNRYEIQREIKQREIIFQLNDKAVGEPEYRAITLYDYRHDGGQFLDNVVIHKVVDEQLWRFNGNERPLRLQQFVDGERCDHPLGDDAAAELSAKFGMARDVVAEALEILYSIN